MMATCILKFPKLGSWVNALLDTYPKTINRVACLLWGTLPLSHKAINGVKTISKWEAKGELLPLIAGINQTKRESFVFRSWSLSDPPTAVPCFFVYTDLCYLSSKVISLDLVEMHGRYSGSFWTGSIPRIHGRYNGSIWSGCA